MNKTEAIALLSKAIRDEVHSPTFGDSEVYWEVNGSEVASGYSGKDVDEVSIYSDETLFTGEDARELLLLGL